MKNALVTGATGAIGPSLVTHLFEAGYRVRTLSRHDSVDIGTQHISGSITDAHAVARALADVDTVFHLAALLHIENPAPEMEAEYRRVNVEGTRLLAEQAARSGVRRFVNFSTVKVYGIHQRQPVPEDHLPHPKTIYARTKYEAEQAAHSIAGLDAITLRLSPVYGPRVKGSWARLIRAIGRGKFVPIGSLQNVHSLTHVEDVVQAAVLVAEHPDAANQIYNLVGHESPTLQQILTAIYAACGRQMPSVRIPASVAVAGAFVVEQTLSAIGKRSPLPVEALRQLVDNETYSGVKLRLLGFLPKVGINEGWSVYQ